MCGIGGFVGMTVSEPARQRTLAELARRGPDAHSVIEWRLDGRAATGEGEVGMLHTRLAIRDPRAIANQPMCNADETIWIVYNGEVYDWEQYVPELEACTGALRTRSDTEFILRGYEAWGIDALLPKLRGMFAFAIVDWRQRVVTLVRDRIGIKPLIYFHDGTRLAFASTVRALLPMMPAAARGVSMESLDAYLAHRYIPAPRTILANANKLAPATVARFELDSGALTTREYWQPRPQPNDWKAALDDAIRLRTVADRPVGVFLSGGVDSAVVACSLSRQGFTNFAAFTASFPGETFDETGDAARLARHFDLVHHPVVIPTRIADDFERIIADFDEPFADPSAIPTWYLARETVKHVTVVLGGDGGDELFAGYKRYRQHLRTRWRAPLHVAGLRPSAADPTRLQKLADEAALDWMQAYTLRFSGYTPAARRALQPGMHSLAPVYWRAGTRHDTSIDALLDVDWRNYLPEYVMRKGDLATMAHGLELREPLLDHEWVARVLALPPNKRFTDPPKTILLEACPQLAAEEINPFLRKKRGFNPPLARWLEGDLRPHTQRLGERLHAMSNGRLAGNVVDEFVAGYFGGARHRAEQVLQLVMLSESLRGLRALA